MWDFLLVYLCCTQPHCVCLGREAAEGGVSFSTEVQQTALHFSDKCLSSLQMMILETWEGRATLGFWKPMIFVFITTEKKQYALYTPQSPQAVLAAQTV